MNLRILFVVIAVITLIVVPSSAYMLNGSVIESRQTLNSITIESGLTDKFELDLITGGYFGGFGGFGGGGAGGRSGSGSSGTDPSYQGRVIAAQNIQFWKENSILNLMYTRMDGNTITATILLTPDSDAALGGTRTVTITNNGFVATDRYYRIPYVGPVTTVGLNMGVVVDGISQQEYFVLSNGINFITQSGASFKWDNETNANMPIYGITTTPIYKCRIDSQQEFTVTTLAVKMSDYLVSYQDALNAPPADSWFAWLGWLFNPLRDAINALTSFISKIKIFFNTAEAFLFFIFAGEIFIGMNAFYIAIAILLSIEDSDDLFKAFGNFYKRMMKLFRFYMELFKAMKNILKWW